MRLLHKFLGTLLAQALVAATATAAVPQAGGSQPVAETVLRASFLAKEVPVDRARRVLIGPDGNFYVLDSGNNRVVVLSPTGSFLRQISEVGQGPGELIDPYDLASDRQGNVFVIDSRNRVQGFSPRGEFLGAFGYQGECLALAVNSRREFFLSQPERGSLVTVYGPTGDYLRSFGQLKGGEGAYRNVANRVHIFVTRGDEVYVSLDHQGILQKYDAGGRLLWETTIPGEQVERLRQVFWSNDLNKSKHGFTLTTSYSRIQAFYVAFNVFYDEPRRRLYVPLNDGSIYVADANGRPVRFMKQPPGSVDFYNSVVVEGRGRVVATSVWRGVLQITPARPV
jgi:DNA-binding beta-propeller fold protein YncE